MTTSNSSSSFGEVVATPIYSCEEDTPTTGLVLAEAPPIEVASVAESVLGGGTTPSSVAPAVET
jgi:hypothetical protein